MMGKWVRNNISKLGWQIPVDVLSQMERFVNWCIWAKLIEVRDFAPSQFAELIQQNRIEADALKKLASSAEDETRRAINK